MLIDQNYISFKRKIISKSLQQALIEQFISHNNKIISLKENLLLNLESLNTNIIYNLSNFYRIYSELNLKSEFLNEFNHIISQYTSLSSINILTSIVDYKLNVSIYDFYLKFIIFVIQIENDEGNERNEKEKDEISKKINYFNVLLIGNPDQETVLSMIFTIIVNIVKGFLLIEERFIYLNKKDTIDKVINERRIIIKIFNEALFDVVSDDKIEFLIGLIEKEYEEFIGIITKVNTSINYNQVNINNNNNIKTKYTNNEKYFNSILSINNNESINYYSNKSTIKIDNDNLINNSNTMSSRGNNILKTDSIQYNSLTYSNTLKTVSSVNKTNSDGIVFNNIFKKRQSKIDFSYFSHLLNNEKNKNPNLSNKLMLIDENLNSKKSNLPLVLTIYKEKSMVGVENLNNNLESKDKEREIGKDSLIMKEKNNIYNTNTNDSNKETFKEETIFNTYNLPIKTSVENKDDLINHKNPIFNYAQKAYYKKQIKRNKSKKRGILDKMFNHRRGNNSKSMSKLRVNSLYSNDNKEKKDKSDFYYEYSNSIVNPDLEDIDDEVLADSTPSREDINFYMKNNEELSLSKVKVNYYNILNQT